MYGFDSHRTYKGQTMIVCKCNSVTDRAVIDCVDSGVIKYYDIQRLTHAGRKCGSCAPQVIEVIAKRRNDGQPI